MANGRGVLRDREQESGNHGNAGDISGLRCRLLLREVVH